MSVIEKILFTTDLPSSFFTIADKVYEALPFCPTHDPELLQKLFRIEAGRNEILIYTDNVSVRLTGIFPHNSSEAFFGFWEGINDSNLHKEAFRLLESDAKAKGRTAITGPVNFNTFHQYRLRKGEPPGWQLFDREPVNPEYYPTLIEAIGYVEKALFQSRLIKRQNIPELYTDKAILLQNLEKISFHFIPLDAGNWIKYEDSIFELVNAVFSQNPLYKSITKEQFALLYNQGFARKLCPYSSVLFQDKVSGELAAISLCYPDYSKTAAPVTNPDFTKDFISLKKKTLLVKTVGVHPRYRRQGLMSYLGAYAMQSFRERYEEVLFCLMRSDNYSLHFSDNLCYEQATYALYQKIIS